jgi:hypothetical protein
MALPDLNSPEAQAAVQAEAERKRQQEAAANAPTGVNTPVADTTGDIASGMVNAVDDFFSAEHVNGADDNGWGEAGTAAAGYNAGAVQKGLSDQAASKGTGNNLFAGSAAQGSDALGFAGGEANNLIGQASAVGQRRAPATNWAGADQYASKADSARNTANALVNQAGSSTQQDAQLAALNQFANSGPGASAAQAQLAAAGDSAQRSALSMARSGRGAGDSASALRDATFSNAATQATTGQNMAQLRAQEEATFRQQQLQALDAAMGGAGAIRGADTAAAQVAQGTRQTSRSSTRRLSRTRRKSTTRRRTICSTRRWDFSARATRQILVSSSWDSKACLALSNSARSSRSTTRSSVRTRSMRRPTTTCSSSKWSSTPQRRISKRTWKKTPALAV